MTRNRDIYGDDTNYEVEYGRVSAQLSSAVTLIMAIALNQKADPGCACDMWLEKNGYDCEKSRRVAHARRVELLDAEIERLKQERAKL